MLVLLEIRVSSSYFSLFLEPIPIFPIFQLVKPKFETKFKMEYKLLYSRTPLFRSPKENGKKFKITGFQNNRESVKGKGKSKGIRSSFKIAGTSN